MKIAIALMVATGLMFAQAPVAAPVKVKKVKKVKKAKAVAVVITAEPVAAPIMATPATAAPAAKK